MSANSWVFQAVFAGVAAWLLLMAVTFLRLLKKYPLGNWTAENPNPHAKETFAMPRGVFRGMLTLSLLYAVVLFEVANIQAGGLEVDCRIHYVHWHLLYILLYKPAFGINNYVLSTGTPGPGLGLFSNRISNPSRNSIFPRAR